MQPSYWGLTIAEWLTLAAIVLGPILAVGTQLWMQARKAKRDIKLWVFNTLMGYRAMILNPNFVQAFNLVDVIFYKNDEVRKKRKEFLDVVTAAAGNNMTPQAVEKCKDLIAEMLAKMGSELGFEFDHTQIKDTGYYPVAFEKMDTAAIALREKGLAVLEGTANIGVVIRNEGATPVAAPAAPRGSTGAPRG
jgi:hypothetical protein